MGGDLLVNHRRKGRVMTKPMTTEELESLSFFLKDNKAALKLALDIIYVGHLWDDLVDRDVQRTTEDINSAFIKAFRDIPDNLFYQTLPPMFQQQLAGLIISTGMQYRDSIYLEMGDQGDRFTGFLIRNAALSIIHYLMFLVGGEDWVDEQGVNFWRTFGLRDQYLEFVEEGK